MDAVVFKRGLPRLPLSSPRYHGVEVVVALYASIQASAGENWMVFALPESQGGGGKDPLDRPEEVRSGQGQGPTKPSKPGRTTT